MGDEPAVTSGSFIISLAHPLAKNPAKTGGKGASLAQLLDLGYAVPPGFVVGADAQRTFLANNDVYHIIDGEHDRLRSSDYLESALAAKHVREAILEGDVSPALRNEIAVSVAALVGSSDSQRLAVRSSGGMEDSASSSWAGQFESYLNVASADIVDYVKLCWASMFGARAISYGIASSVNYERSPFAVVVQVMVQGDVSGVAFSVEPLEVDPNKILIEAARGAGELVVSGRESPYSVVVDKAEGIVLRRSFGSYLNTELINTGSLRQLTRVVAGIERDFGFPVDVEWTLQGDQLSILQARPITVHGSNQRSSTGSSDLPDVLDYELTFKVTGLGFLFSDMLIRGFGYLRPLLTSLHDEFRQYFPKERMEYAAREGYRWLSRPGGFAEYRVEFEQFHTRAATEIGLMLERTLSPEDVLDFFALMEGYFERYSKTDFQFTNLTYLYAEEDPVVKENLQQLADFKDVARVWINEVAIDEDGHFATFLARLSSQVSVAGEVLEACKISELLNLFSKWTPDLIDLDERRDSFAIFVDGDQVRYLSGPAASAYCSVIAVLEESQARSDIVGQVANRTSVASIEGIVRVINVDYGDLEKMDREIAMMELGEILVSEFTAPELMGACRKARALVTDLGGMLSHAAIVSRELGIPSLVGTRHASKALSTGDRVAIDFNSGFVEKIS